VKGKIKNTLAPKFLAVLVPIGALGKIGDEFVLEDAQGGRILLRDRPEDGADHACTERLGMLPRAIPTGSALFGLMFYDGRDKALCLHPYSVVTPDGILRLQY
ncbi:MAG: metal-binding protein, partial [Oscillospiraceae bacterium]|nr:metal-binding protein [Oscillospiraceae bacterium]